MGYFIGKVISVDDEFNGKRIRARIPLVDDKKTITPYAFPLLPKMIDVPPKVDEAVIIFCEDDDPSKQRLYLGPVISQYQHMDKDFFDYGALKLLGNSGKGQGGGCEDVAVDNIAKTHGAFGGKNDISIYGRRNSDIIIGDNDIRIRCGAKIVNPYHTDEIAFNKTNPSYIKLRYLNNPLELTKPKWDSTTKDFVQHNSESPLESCANIVAQEINLISTNSGNPNINTSNTEMDGVDNTNKGNEGVSDEDIVKFIKEAHPIPYGDVLIKFLHLFVEAFNNHTHKYSQLPPVPDITYNTMNNYFNTIDEKILSKNIRIN